MPGFSSYDAIVNALSVSGKGQEVFFSKTAPVAQVTGAFHTSWAYTGIPTAGTWLGPGGATGFNMVAANSNSVGAMTLVSPTTVSGENPYLLTAGALASTAVLGTLMLVDRLADTGALTTAAGGTCTFSSSLAWPRYADGLGVMAFIESLTATPASGSVVTLNYTNTDSTAGRITSGATSVAATHRVIGSSSGPFFALQGTDKGIKTIESLSVGTTTASNIALVVCKPLLMLPCTTANYYTERDLVIQTPKLPKLQVSSDATACLQWIFFAGAATTPVLTGSVAMVTG